MPYCSAADVRLISGVSNDVVSDRDIDGLIGFSDQQIDDEIQPFSAPVPTRIKHLSALLTAIRIFSRPDLRFRIGQAGITEQQTEANLERWRAEVARIYAYYGRSVLFGPGSLKVG